MGIGKLTKLSYYSKPINSIETTVSLPVHFFEILEKVMCFEPVHKRKYLTTKGIVTCTSRLAMQFLNLEQSLK